MRCVWFDCFNGAAGDMIIASLLDAGMDFDVLAAELAKLGVEGYHVEVQKVVKGTISATRFDVVLDDHSHDRQHRHLRHIERIIDDSALDARVKEGVRRIFRRLGEAEASVHGVDVDTVHFHEVGAVDAIVDIVGTMVCLEAMGIERVAVGPLRTGSGFVECAHGRLPVPAPATAELIKGFPTAPSDVEGELLTPTGAAILTTLGEQFGAMPALKVTAVGYGAGRRETQPTPNVLRVFVGESPGGGAADEVCVLETNIDDMPAEFFEVLFERLFAAGALDVFTAAIQMKKGRPAQLLTVIVEEEKREACEEIVFRETTTFGIRRATMARRKLEREIVTVKTDLGEVRVKVGKLDGETVTVSPEYEDCRRIAAERMVPLKDVYDAAKRAAWKV